MKMHVRPLEGITKDFEIAANGTEMDVIGQDAWPKGGLRAGVYEPRSH